MLIKKEYQLKPDDIVKIDNKELKVLEVYSHWVLFQMIEEPFLKYSYQNTQLMFNHKIYKREALAKGVICGESD